MRLRCLLGLVVVCACSSGDDSEPTEEEREQAAGCAALIERYRDCELLDEGEDRCAEQDYDPCVLECAIAASCDDLWSSICAGGELLDLGNAVLEDDTRDCIRQCAEALENFHCMDGEDLVPGSFRCDGDEDCGDGSDEVDCGDRLFTCDNSTAVPASYRCDAVDDCGDGSDEDGCPTLQCADGSGEVPDAYRCDFEEDCPDGSDEDGCAAPQCD